MFVLGCFPGFRIQFLGLSGGSICNMSEKKSEEKREGTTRSTKTPHTGHQIYDIFIKVLFCISCGQFPRCVCMFLANILCMTSCSMGV